LDFTQFVNRNVKILGRRLYSPSSLDVVGPQDFTRPFFPAVFVRVTHDGHFTSLQIGTGRPGSREGHHAISLSF